MLKGAHWPLLLACQPALAFRAARGELDTPPGATLACRPVSFLLLLAGWCQPALALKAARGGLVGVGTGCTPW